MAETRRLAGGCACGAVRFTAEAPREYGVCHCETCRRWTGGPNLAVDCGSGVEIEGPVSVWNSSDWAERGSCARCGSPLFYRLKATGAHYLAVGAFDDQEGWEMTEQIFIDAKPAHFAFANETRTMTEAEVMAAWAASQSGEQ
ncbi:MAG TPA: GFA family protein [Paracoccaceae bacterium]|nr:GFA family protein [Paracoccaceae bacterium]